MPETPGTLLSAVATFFRAPNDPAKRERPPPDTRGTAHQPEGRDGLGDAEQMFSIFLEQSETTSVLFTMPVRFNNSFPVTHLSIHMCCNFL